MAFFPDHTRNHLALNEADILQIFRSNQNVVPPDPLFLGHPCQAYICTARENKLLCVYVAIFDTSARKTQIFAPPGGTKDNGMYERLIKEALAFTGSMGFSLDPVNLDYSAAMRQVIIRDLRIMRPPPQQRHISPVAQAEDIVQPANPSPTHPENHEQDSVQADSMPEMPTPGGDDLKERLFEQINRLQKDNSELKTVSDAKTLELTQLLQQATAANRISELALKQLKKTPTTEICESTAAVHSTSNAEIERLETALTLETTMRHETEAAVATLRDENNRMLLEHQRQREELENRLAEIQDACTELKEALAEETVLRNKEGLAAKNTQTGLQDDLMSLRIELEDKQVQLRLKENELFTVSKDRNRLKEKLEKADAVNEARLLEELKAAASGFELQLEAGRQLEVRLEELTLTHEETVIEKELECRRLSGEIKSVTTRFDRIAAEKKVWDSIAANFRKKARSAVEKLQKEKDDLEKEVRRLNKLTSVAVQDLKATKPKEENNSPFAAFGFASQTAFSVFAESIAESGSDFRHDPAFDTIRYQNAEEIIELYGSANVVQAAPFGRRSQNCNAFICVVEREQGPHIYLAWQLIEESAVQFCLPKKQPGSARNYARMLQDALYYFESVGFMMDRFELSRGSERQLQALERTGVCRLDSLPALPHETIDNDDICHLEAAA